MARGWKCARCSNQNGEGVMNCAKCGLLQGAVFVPSAYVPPEPAGASEPPARDDSRPEVPNRSQSAAPDDSQPAGFGQPAAPDHTPQAWPSGLPPAAQGVGAPLHLGSGDEQPSSGWVPPYPIAPSAQVATRPLWRRIPIRLAIFGVVILAGAVGGLITNASRSSEGDITKGGDLVSNDLRIGDCWDMKDRSAKTVDDVAGKPCAEAHEYEVIYIGRMPGEGYPTDDAFDAYVERSCVPAFETYIGRTYEDSGLDISWLYPSTDSWKSGDRTVQCSAYDPDNSGLIASVKGTGQ
jgi:putative regulator of septum formation